MDGSEAVPGHEIWRGQGPQIPEDRGFVSAGEAGESYEGQRRKGRRAGGEHSTRKGREEGMSCPGSGVRRGAGWERKLLRGVAGRRQG